MRIAPWALAAAFGILAGSQPSAAQTTSCGPFHLNAVAVPADDPAFEGLYEYTLTGRWDRDRPPLESVDLLLNLGTCPCACDEGVVVFTALAGTAVGYLPGDPEPCGIDFTGEYACEGDPTLGAFEGPTVRFLPEVQPGCGGGVLGEGTWTFYSSFPPAEPANYPDAAALNLETELCMGSIVGQMPECRCATPAREASWGRLKAVYR